MGETSGNLVNIHWTRSVLEALGYDIDTLGSRIKMYISNIQHRKA